MCNGVVYYSHCVHIFYRVVEALVLYTRVKIIWKICLLKTERFISVNPSSSSSTRAKIKNQYDTIILHFLTDCFIHDNLVYFNHWLTISIFVASYVNTVSISISQILLNVTFIHKMERGSVGDRWPLGLTENIPVQGVLAIVSSRFETLRSCSVTLAKRITARWLVTICNEMNANSSNIILLVQLIIMHTLFY